MANRITIVLLTFLSVLFTILFCETEGLIKNDTEPAADEATVVSDVLDDDFSDTSESEADIDVIKDYHGGYDKYHHGGHYEPKGDHYDKYDKYDYKYKKSGAYGGYAKKGKGKGDKKDDYDKEKYYGYKDDKYCHKEKSNECVCYVAVQRTENQVDYCELYQSINGGAATMASVYSEARCESAGVASNRARGAYCVNNDIEMFAATLTDDSTPENEDVYLSRFEASSSSVSRVYTHETGLLWGDQSNILVTRILMKRLYKIIDAYYLEFSFGYAQYDVNALTCKKVCVSFPQSICYDTAFFKEDNSRFVCQGRTGSNQCTYLRDPETGVNFMPPNSNNPWRVGRGDWYTSVRLCKKNYISSIGLADEGVVVARARMSLKYPYFKDIEEVWTFPYPGNAPATPQHSADAIYTPAHTNTIYVCYSLEDNTSVKSYFARFDEAYTDETLIEPDQITEITALAKCQQIIGFNKCTNEIYYVGVNGNLYYSSDNGVSFSLVTQPGVALSITGFSRPKKDYY